MKRVTFVAVALALAVRLPAAEGPANPEAARHNFQPHGQVVIVPGQGFVAGPPGQIPGGQLKSPAAWYIESIDKDVDLTDDQKRTITEIIEARDAAIVEWRKDNSESLAAASAALAEAARSQDRDAAAKAQKEYQDQYVAMHAIMQEYQEKLQNVLTAEQIARQQIRRRDALISNMIRSYAGPAILTPEQVAGIHDALAAEPSPEAAARRLFEVVQQVLTPEQKTAVAKHRAMHHVKALYARAALTEQQQEQAEAICEELAADPDMPPAEAYPKLKQRIDALLTDEQREAMQASPGLPPPPAVPAIPAAPAAHWPPPQLAPRMAPDPAIQELRSEMQALRREVEALRKLVDRPAEPEPKR